MSPILKLQSAWVRPVEDAHPPGQYAVDVDLRTRLDEESARDVTVRVTYQGGREVDCVLLPEPEERVEYDLIVGFAKRVAHDVLSPDNAPLPIEATITFPAPARQEYKFRLIGNQGSELVRWEVGEEF